MKTEQNHGMAQCAGVALLRWALGLMFLVGGVAKLFMLKGFVTGYLAPAFADAFLPAFGQMLIQSQIVSSILMYILMTAVALIFQPQDGWIIGCCKSTGGKTPAEPYSE